MLKKIYKSALEDTLLKKQLLMIFCFFLLFSNVALSLKIFTISTAQETIIHPTSMIDPYSYGEFLDPDYVIELSEQFLTARFLYTPKTVAKSFDGIAQNFHPAIYGEKKAELDSESEKIIRNSETSVFFPMSSHAIDDKAYIEAEITGYIGKKFVTQFVKTFEVELRRSGGRVWIYDWRPVILDPTGKNYLPSNFDKESNSVVPLEG